MTLWHGSGRRGDECIANNQGQGELPACEYNVSPEWAFVSVTAEVATTARETMRTAYVACEEWCRCSERINFVARNAAKQPERIFVRYTFGLCTR